MVVLTGCHQDNDEFFTQAQIEVDGGDDISVERIQATATLTNLNTKQTTVASSFEGSTLQVELLRGAYQVTIEGMVRYTAADGSVKTQSFRAVSDYLELTQTPVSKATLELIMMQ